MKRPLPLLEARPRERARAPRELPGKGLAPAERLRVPHLLVCVSAGDDDDARIVRFAACLLSSLRALGSGAALVLPPAPRFSREAEASLAEAGAAPIVRLGDLRASAASALAGLGLERPVLALGAELLAGLRPALSISLASRPPWTAETDSTVELWLGRDGEGAAMELAPLLAAAAENTRAQRRSLV